MAFPDEILADDEEVVIHLHPHWKTMIKPGLILVLVAAIVGFAAFSLPDNGVGQFVLLFLGAFGTLSLLVWVLWPFLTWRTTHYVFTTHRVLLRHGVLSRHGRDIPLARINDVSFSHNLVERMLGCGTLVLESAGESGQLVLSEIPGVEQVQSSLYQLVEEDHDRRNFQHEEEFEGEATS
ncbi:PH domain-containing protein [Longispora albida]|uniref:PH domain-containing protein n=1 Tax=Longispora albida TaxID=203523 RepID=UPI000371B388|nr:PH domain-containing protein [Longispora albida]